MVEELAAKGAVEALDEAVGLGSSRGGFDGLETDGREEPFVGCED
jgi:hypothetical protein